MFVLESDALRVRIGQPDRPGEYGLTTEVHYDGDWLAASRIGSRPLDGLTPTQAGPGHLAGTGEGYRWRATITAQARGFWVEARLQADRAVAINPAMVLWLGTLDNLDDRQAHTWRQTILRAPTVNQQGLSGNDLAAGYLYDHATHIESICYFPADGFEWASNRFYHFTVREVMAYLPTGRYGLGLLPAMPGTLFSLNPGEHRFVWWFTQRHRSGMPSPWEAQHALLQALAPLLDVVPAAPPETIAWGEMAGRTLSDLRDEACWVQAGGHEGLRAYVRGSSALKRDEARSIELMTQLDVLWPLLLWQDEAHEPRAHAIIERIHQTLPLFDRPTLNYVANNFPAFPGDSFMDTWYFLENALIKLPWVAYLTGDETLRAMFFRALHGAQKLARHTNYLFPLFADAEQWQARGSLLNVSVGGLYAAGCVIAHQLSGGDADHLREAALALRTMHQLPPHQLTHEPQQLSFAAASASYLQQMGYEADTDWATMAADFVNLSLRMGYWAKDPAVPFYDPRGMFQACASLCYPAFKENVEVLVAWPELLRAGLGPVTLMAAFANLQRRHNYAFFDPYLPENLRRGPCPYVPYEDLATAEFEHTAKLGKELYGTGEVFWSALLFDALGRVDAPHVLCLCLDVPCLELRRLPPPALRSYLVYNPLPEAQHVTLRNTARTQALVIAPHSAEVVSFAESD